MIAYVLFGLFILSCIVLILAVLLQPGKADAGALFTSSVSSTAFGPRGTQTLLAKITIGAAILFMLTALTLSFGVGGRYGSVLDSQGETPAVPLPAAPVAPQASPETAPSGEVKTPGDANATPAESNTNTAAPPANETAPPPAQATPAP